MNSVLAIDQSNTRPASNGRDAQLLRCLQTLLEGQFPSIPDDNDEVHQTLFKFVKLLEQRTEADLARTVGFSVQASEAMASVANITGDIREADDRTQSMAAAVEQLDASFRQVSTASAGAAEEADDVRSRVAIGVDTVGQGVSAMKEIADSVDAMAKRVETLTTASEQIANILQTINAITKQTNLLALNATIEAARAGDAGKGFGVVASEVKNLAGQTHNASGDIREKIQTLRTEMVEFQSAMEVCGSTVEKGREIIDSVGDEFRQIGEKVQSSAQRSHEIAALVSEQTKATQEIATGVSGVSTMTGRTKKNVENSLKAVGQSEVLVNEQFTELEKLTIRNYILHRAKSDHFLWKKNLSEMFVGINNLQEEELADHHSCRLGKWYDAVDDASIQTLSAYVELEDPHSRVHTHGKAAARFYASGDREQARAEFELMEVASKEVVALLDQLINAAESRK